MYNDEVLLSEVFCKAKLTNQAKPFVNLKRRGLAKKTNLARSAKLFNNFVNRGRFEKEVLQGSWNKSLCSFYGNWTAKRTRRGTQEAEGAGLLNR